MKCLSGISFTALNDEVIMPVCGFEKFVFPSEKCLVLALEGAFI